MIDFLSLQKINEQYESELIESATATIRSGWHLYGENITSFEKALSAFIDSPNVITCANGLDALRLILRAYMHKP
jgi:dTDP-4-amino-4,6-dideoxygalactose transaminase